MAQTQTTYSRIFAWWQQGLFAPFSGLRKLPTNVCIIDGIICDHQARPLSETQIAALKASEGVVLLLLPESVMTKRVSETQKGLPLASVIAEVLPFESTELVSVWGSGQEHILCALKSDLVTTRSIVESQSLKLLGYAFKERLDSRDSEYLYAFDDTQASSSTTHKIWLPAVLLILVLLCATFGYLSKKADHRIALLSAEIGELTLETEVSQASESRAFSSLIRLRTATEITELLTSLSNDLTESTMIDQLILSGNELLIDASAQSASKLQNEIEDSDFFVGTEFVSSISRSAGDDIERFRLQAILRKPASGKQDIKRMNEPVQAK